MNDNPSNNNLTPRRDGAIKTHIVGGPPDREVTVGDFLNLRDRAMGDPIDELKRTLESVKSRRGPKPDGKSKRERSSPALAYQVRNITAGVWGFYFSNPEEDHRLPVSHWLGDNGYEAIHPNVGLKFDSPGKAKQFRANGFRHKVSVKQ